MSFSQHLAAGKIKLESDLTINTTCNSLWIEGLNISKS